MSNEGIHIISTGKAREIVDNKPVVLIYGPDAQLKPAKAAYLSKSPDVSVYIRATDNPSLDAHDAGEVRRRILLVSAMSPQWEAKFKAWGQEYVLAELKDGKLVHYDPAEIENQEQERLANAPPDQTYRLQNGVLVDKARAFAKAAENIGMTGDAFGALPETSIAAAIHAAFDVKYTPPPAPQPETKKKPK